MTREEILTISKPILFNTEMVWAILDNRKKATRRIAKSIIPFDDHFEYFNVFKRGKWSGPLTKEQIIEEYAPCKVGDYLYVRETWCNINKPGIDPDYYYFADTRICEDYMTSEWRWHPSIHMPKDAARIFLRVTDVRFERLQDMETPNYENYLAEGAKDKHDFIRIWDSTVKRERCGWYTNPRVWVIEFERVKM